MRRRLYINNKQLEITELYEYCYLNNCINEEDVILLNNKIAQLGYEVSLNDKFKFYISSLSTRFGYSNSRPLGHNIDFVLYEDNNPWTTELDYYMNGGLYGQGFYSCELELLNRMETKERINDAELMLSNYRYSSYTPSFYITAKCDLIYYEDFVLPNNTLFSGYVVGQRKTEWKFISYL